MDFEERRVKAGDGSGVVCIFRICPGVEGASVRVLGQGKNAHVCVCVCVVVVRVLASCCDCELLVLCWSQ